MIAIIAALKDEIRTVLSKTEVDETVHIKPSAIYCGKYHGRGLILATSGVGTDSMRHAASYLLKNFRPELVLLTGYAGGSDPSLVAGDLVVAVEVKDKESENVFRIDGGLRDKAAILCRDSSLKYKEGGIVTVKKPVLTSHEKAFVGTQYEAIAIDMESSALAEESVKSKTPFLIVRSILDPLEMVLPNVPEEVFSDSDLNMLEYAKHLIRHPKDIFNLPRFTYCTGKARESITKFIDAWVG